ncbi:activator of HSP90 ATPase [Actinoplanes sp. NPDC048988]|uniref:activator of HSP90 ATPase n=1 Tax=Actinoplanes sp. NPDC048988 TaxID=3363901 RepID=UPI0037220B12
MTDRRPLKPYDVEISLPVGRDQAWEAVTRPEVLRQWFGWDYDGLDAEIRQIFIDEATLWAPERMGWADGSSLEVDGTDDQSRVRVSREGTGPAGEEVYDAIEEGWRAFLTQLAFLLRERPTGRRRTIYLTGETTGHQALTLSPGDWQHFGPRVASTIDPDGHLVVVAGHLPLNAPSAARFEVTISTFGLDDPTFESTRETWAKRWAPLAADANLTTAENPAPTP